ncbi:hypothetical protein ACHAW6_004958 [Cyclotella cf. meneghiniana]
MAPGGRHKVAHDAIWDEHFQAFKTYFEAHGSYPPKKNDTEKLARWVYKQRCRAKNNRLSSRRIALLNALNFDWGFPLSSIKPMRASVVPRPDASVSGHEHDTADKHDSDVRPDAKVNGRASRGRLDFRFNVKIPSYYKEISEATKISYSFNEAIREEGIGETKGGEHRKAENFDCIGKTPNDTTAPNLHAQRTTQHNVFISALEKYGSNAGSEESTAAWHAMATALKWSLKDVKVYAYSYFKSLTEGNLEAGGSENIDVKGTAAGAVGGIQSSWTRDELVLLDSLMLKYCKCRNDFKNVHGDRNSSGSSYLIRTPSAWENIAARLPRKTSKECYEMGTSRFSVLDINNNMEDWNLMRDPR